MSELLPGRQAMRLRDGLIDYLTTTFALVGSDAQAALRELLEDEAEGMFKGPYLRTGMPFSPAPRREAPPLDWIPPGFVPYAHQAAAFRRLSSLSGRPQAIEASDGLATRCPTKFAGKCNCGQNECVLGGNGCLVPIQIRRLRRKNGDDLTEEERTATHPAGAVYTYELPFGPRNREAGFFEVMSTLGLR